MPKARITKPSGTTIVIEGSADEIADLVGKIESHGKQSTMTGGVKAAGKRTKIARASLPDLLIALLDGGFFKKPKDLSAVKEKLSEMGHVYPITTLSPALLRLVRARNIRRVKQDNRWFYTG